MAGSRRPQDAWKPAAGGSGPPGHPRGTKSGGARRWFGVAVLLGALAGAAVGLFYYLRPDPEPVLLAIPVTQYGHPDWPANPWAEADARGLRDRFGGDSAQATQTQEKARIVRELNRAADDSRQNRRRPLVVYLSTLGVALDGKPYLIPGDGTPDDPGSWLTLNDILDPLRRTDARRLLILDVRPVRSPRCAFPAEDVNELLDAALAKLDQAGDLPFWVLTANTPADGPTVLRPVRRTAFGLAVAHGLGGAADGWGGDRAKDGRVSVRELAAYTSAATHAAATSPQRPRLHGRGDDFRLFPVPTGGPAPLPSPADAEPYPPWLLDGWGERDGWLTGKLDRRAPRLMNQYTAAALRAEGRWLGGLDTGAIEAQFRPVATEIRETEPRLRAVVPAARSVARVRGLPGVDVPAAEKVLQAAFDKVRDPGPKPKDGDPPPPKLTQPPADTKPYDASATAIYTFALGLRPTHTQVRDLAALARAFKPHPGHVELLTLDLIAGVPESHRERWDVGTIELLLTTVRDAEEAVAGDGRCLPWVRDTLDRADATRRAAVRTLCEPERERPELEAARARLADARKDYQAVAAAVRDLTDAFAAHEEARAGLADLAVWYPDALARDAQAVDDSWAALVDHYRQLSLLLRPPPTPALPNGGDLTRRSQGIRKHLRDLRGYVEVPPNATQRQLELALRWPVWSRGERAGLYDRLERAGRETWDRAQAKWPGAPVPEPAPPSAQAGLAVGSVRELRRVFDVLDLADAPDAAEIKRKLLDLGPTPTPAALAEVAGRVRGTWRQKLPETYHKADPAAQTRFGWAVDTDDEPATWPAEPSRRAAVGDRPNPELAHRRAQERAFHQWLAVRYTADARDIREVKLTEGAAGREAYAAGLDAAARDYQRWSP